MELRLSCTNPSIHSRCLRQYQNWVSPCWRMPYWRRCATSSWQYIRRNHVPQSSAETNVCSWLQTSSISSWPSLTKCSSEYPETCPRLSVYPRYSAGFSNSIVNVLEWILIHYWDFFLSVANTCGLYCSTSGLNLYHHLDNTLVLLHSLEAYLAETYGEWRACENIFTLLLWEIFQET